MKDSKYAHQIQIDVQVDIYFLPSTLKILIHVFFLPFHFYLNIIDIQRCKRLSLQQYYLTHKHHKMITTMSFMNIHDAI